MESTPRSSELRSQLERLEPFDALEREHKLRMLQLLDSAPDAFDRAHYIPGHVTASAFVVDAAHEHLLLILHGKLGRWLQPGGHVDPADLNVAAAAQREVLEETGVAVHLPLRAHLLDVDVHLIPARNTAPPHEHFDVRFAFEAQQTEVHAGSDARAARWVRIRDLLEGSPDLPSDESVLRAVRKLRARWL